MPDTEKDRDGELLEILVNVLPNKLRLSFQPALHARVEAAGLPLSKK